MQNAAAAGSLVSSKAARDVQMLIDATRQNLHDELDVQWDKLDREKIDFLRALNSQVDRIQDISNQFGILKTTFTLIPILCFQACHLLKRCLAYAESTVPLNTSKRMVISTSTTANVFAPFGAETHVFVGKEEMKVASKPPYSAILSIPHEKLQFNDFQTIEVPLTIKTQLEDNSLFSKKKKNYEFTAFIELYPKYPAYYQMDESVNTQVVDPSQLAVARGAQMTIAGCGDSGCNAYYNVCTPVPVGVQVTRTVNLYDSFSGWGGFGAVTVGNGSVCQVYWQHSHNVARNVSIDVEYHPLKPEIQHNPLLLQPVIAGKSPAPLCTPRSDGTQPGPGQTVTPTAVGASSTVCWLQFGNTYLAEFSPTTTGYKLAVHTFNGQNYSVVDGATDQNHPGIDVQTLPGSTPKKSMFKILEPKI